MPQVPTDIPHFAFTHHRIGLHSNRKYAEKPAGSDLVPLQDLSHLSEIDKNRSLGLACLDLYERNSGNPKYDVYRSRALDLLKQVYESGQQDASVAAALSKFALLTRNSELAQTLATEALKSTDIRPADRMKSLNVLAQFHLDAGELDLAADQLTILTRLRREPTDWFMLGVCEQRRGRTTAAVQAFEYALKIDPAQSVPHRALIPLYRTLGDSQKAQWHADREKLLPPAE